MYWTIFVIFVALILNPFVALSFDGYCKFGHAPCCVNDNGMPHDGSRPVKFPSDLIGHILSLRKALVDRLEEMKHLCTVGEDVSFISKNLDEMKMNVYERPFDMDWNDLLRTMRKQYNILNTLALYLLEISRTTNDVSANISLKRVLRNVYKVMCVMKQILRSYNRDPNVKVPSGQLADIFTEFVRYSQNIINGCEQQQVEYVIEEDCEFRRCKQQQAEYVIVHDCEKFIRYLIHFYGR